MTPMSPRIEAFSLLQQLRPVVASPQDEAEFKRVVTQGVQIPPALFDSWSRNEGDPGLNRCVTDMIIAWGRRTLHAQYVVKAEPPPVTTMCTYTKETEMRSPCPPAETAVEEDDALLFAAATALIEASTVEPVDNTSPSQTDMKKRKIKDLPARPLPKCTPPGLSLALGAPLMKRPASTSGDEHPRKRSRAKAKEISSPPRPGEPGSKEKSGPKRVGPNHTKASTSVLMAWLVANLKRPYPTEDTKAVLSSESGLTVPQVCHWFINARKRIWQPLWKAEQSRLGLESDSNDCNGPDGGDHTSAEVSPRAKNAQSSNGSTAPTTPVPLAIAPPKTFGAHTPPAGWRVEEFA
eukprot:CAMPEP_0114560566 /NCGR_PEP_ID=MMETSP0114-20121206/11527_1 /TAXON_ID=31324 /ORGANISM="Goniomonas sp, Strain m" /LENGTH=349 /DNA_ID=CAMNT_0001746119 /DNA_START=86 /DNA_END=1135 /DNA_ORIENTATION=-